MTETVAERHRRLAAHFHAIVEAVPPDQLSRPTGCEGWTVADVIDHVVSTQRDFLSQRSLPAGDGNGDDQSGGEPLAAVASASSAMQAALDDPAVADTTFDGFFGPTTIAEVVDTFYCLDLVVHGWDIASALDLSEHLAINDPDIERIQRLLQPAGDNIRMEGIFGPAVEIGPSATAQEEFLAWTGRDPRHSGS